MAMGIGILVLVLSIALVCAFGVIVWVSINRGIQKDTHEIAQLNNTSKTLPNDVSDIDYEELAILGVSKACNVDKENIDAVRISTEIINRNEDPTTFLVFGTKNQWVLVDVWDMIHPDGDRGVYIDIYISTNDAEENEDFEKYTMAELIE